MQQAEFSRRSFLKWSAGALAGAALFQLCQQPTEAKTKAPELHAVPFDQIPQSCESIAKKSPLVQQNWQQLQHYADSIRSSSLRGQVQGVLNNPAPTFMSQYGSGDAKVVYAELQRKNLVDEKKTTSAQLFPPLQDANTSPQPFMTAPGSGYASHHPYPGGLVTHTAANVAILIGIYHAYQQTFGYDCDYDIAVAGELLHDLAKPYVFQWQKDGSSLPEYTVAGTGAHHIFSIAESIYRGLPAEVIYAQACAHNHPGSSKDAAQVEGWLQAASILAGKDPVQLGLLTKDYHLQPPIRPEGFLVHLGDHDWVLSGFAANQCVAYLADYAKRKLPAAAKKENSAAFNRFRNYVGSQLSYMRLYQILSSGGTKKADQLVEQVVRV